MENTPQPEPGPARVETTGTGAGINGLGNNGPGNEGPGNAGANSKATNSLVLAILAPASMLLTAPASMFAMLMTYSDNGHSDRPWVTPFVLFSLPVLFASLGLRQALPALKQLPRGSGSWSAAAVALCICGLVFALALGPVLDLIGVF